MNFELRKLRSDDLFLMFTILSKVGFKEFRQELTPDKLKMLTDEKDSTAFGFNIMVMIVETIMKGLPNCKKEVYSFLSSLSGISVEELSELDMVTFTELIVAVVKKEEFKDFFKAVAKLFN